MPFLHLLERHNGMTMKPAPDAPQQPERAADPFQDAFKSVLEDRPALTLVAKR